MIHIYKIPDLFDRISKNLIWKINTEKKDIFLTFDDGPIPKLTNFVLDVLEDFDALATFFCVGDNISKYPGICEDVIAKNHLIGNHTHNHLKGWSTKTDQFVANIKECQRHISEYQKIDVRPVFRPPYGQITPKQINSLKAKYHIIMWDILTYDFDITHSPQKSLDKIIKKTGPGSIIVFHDNYKAEEKLNYMLPRYLQHFKEKGYNFKKLEPHSLPEQVN